MKEKGYALLQVWLDTHEHEALKRLASEDGTTKVQWVRERIRKMSGIGLYSNR